MLERFLPGCVLAIFLAAGAYQTAFASLWLVFEPSAAQPGTLVSARTAGAQAFASEQAGSAFPVYLTPPSDLDQISSEADKRLVRVGVLLIDAHGSGALAVHSSSAGAGNVFGGNPVPTLRAILSRPHSSAGGNFPSLEARQPLTKPQNSS